MKRAPKPLRIDAILASLLKNKRWQQGILGARIKLLWPEMVSPEIAAHTRPGGLFRGRLLVYCEHDVWRTELTYLRPELLARINEVLEGDYVKEIWLK